MPKVALVETKKSKTNFHNEFDEAFEFDQFQLCSDPFLKKVLKRDCDIQINTDDYDWVILVGSDALKYFTPINSITEYSGKKVEEKFLPIINPAMLAFKPEAQRTWDDSKQSIIEYITDNKQDHSDYRVQCLGYSEIPQKLMPSSRLLSTRLLLMSHLTRRLQALWPRDGHMLGLSLSYERRSWSVH